MLNKIKNLFKKQISIPQCEDNGIYFTWKRGEVRRLSEHFLTTEFECHCGKCVQQKIAKTLILKLEALRKALGRPLRITSGYRCTQHQKTLSNDKTFKTAKKTSTHELGQAADLHVITKTPLGFSIATKKLRRLLPTFFMAIGDGVSWFHVDLRIGTIRRWDY